MTDNISLPSILYARYALRGVNEDLVLTQNRIGPSKEQIIIMLRYDRRGRGNFQPIAYAHHSSITGEGLEKLTNLNKTLLEFDNRIEDLKKNPREGVSTFSGEISVGGVLYEAVTRAGINAITSYRDHRKSKGDGHYRVAQVNLLGEEKLPTKLVILVDQLREASSSFVKSLEDKIEGLRT